MTHCTERHNGGGRLESARGAALVTVLMMLMILSALGTAMTTSGQTEMMVARNAVSAAQSHAAAESGLNHAVELTIPNLQQFTANGFANVSAAITALLVGPDGLSGTAATDAEPLVSPTTGASRSSASRGRRRCWPRGGQRGDLRGSDLVGLGAANGVTYEARIFDDDDPARGTALTAADVARIGEDNDPTTDANSTVVIQAIGYALDNTMVTLEATMANAAVNLPAIAVGGELTISGNPTITGTQGGVHANDDLDISGNPDIAQNATATGDFDISGSPSIGGISGGGHASLPIPPVAAIDHKVHADFILNATGQMTDQLGNVICDASADNSACQTAGYDWEYKGVDGWAAPANGETAGTYYVEGDANISGNHGSAADPWAVTIIAEGSIEIGGNSDITPDTPELLFVTDGDLKISGALDTDLTVEGAILVHEQIQLSGNPTLSGQIIVEDADNASDLVTENTISGNATISYNGTLGGGGGAGIFTLSAWREVR